VLAVLVLRAELAARHRLRSELEWEGVGKLWDESVADRVRTLQDLDLCIFAARRDSAPWEFDALRESLTEYLNEYPTTAA